MSSTNSIYSFVEIPNNSLTIVGLLAVNGVSLFTPKNIDATCTNIASNILELNSKLYVRSACTDMVLIVYDTLTQDLKSYKFVDAQQVYTVQRYMSSNR